MFSDKNTKRTPWRSGAGISVTALWLWEGHSRMNLILPAQRVSRAHFLAGWITTEQKGQWHQGTADLAQICLKTWLSESMNNQCTLMEYYTNALSWLTTAAVDFNKFSIAGWDSFTLTSPTCSANDSSKLFGHLFWNEMAQILDAYFSSSIVRGVQTGSSDMAEGVD